MISDTELAQMRADETALLPDVCTVTRAGAGARVFDENTGTYTDPPRQTIYQGAVRVSPLPVQDRAVLFGERAVDLVAYRASFPHDVPAFQKDDILEVTQSADPQLVGRQLEVHGYEAKSLQTKRRVLLQEVR